MIYDYRDPAPDTRIPNTYHLAREAMDNLVYTIARVCGKKKAYPNIDKEVVASVTKMLGEPMGKLTRMQVCDFFQEIICVLTCPASELYVQKGVNENEARVILMSRAIKDILRLNTDKYNIILEGLLSWKEEDIGSILSAIKEVFSLAVSDLQKVCKKEEP